MTKIRNTFCRMDFDLPSWIVLFVSLFIFLATLLRVTKPEPDPHLNLPPGPRQLPLIGNLHNLLASFQPPHRTLSDLAAKHGPVMQLQLGEVSAVVISSPEAAKEVMKTHDIAFANRPSLLAAEIIFYNKSDIAFAPYGEHWRQLRKICTIELLSSRRVQLLQPLREEEFSNMCRWIASKDGSSINLTERVDLATCDVVMRASLGNRTDELTTFIPIVHGISELLGGLRLSDLYPSIKVFQLFSRIRSKAERLHKMADTILGNVLNNHKVAKNESKQREDLASVLLMFNDAGHELHLTTDQIKAVLQDVFTAGIETSSSLAEWAMAEMLRDPKLLKKAQDEVRLIFDDKGFVDESEFDKLKYLKLVIRETLRMHPPGPLLLPRQSDEDCEIHGYKIPAKTRVMVNAWAIGRDPKHWKEANRFIPERHLDSQVDYRGNNFEYIPFGAGRRICPGLSFGLANVELPLAMLLYHFDWVLPDGIEPQNLDMKETLGLTARRKNPLYVIPKLKRPLLVKEN